MTTTEQRYREAGMRPPRNSGDFPSDSWTVKRLRSYAEEHQVDLSGASVKADILAAVTAAPINPDDPFLEA